MTCHALESLPSDDPAKQTTFKAQIHDIVALAYAFMKTNILLLKKNKQKMTSFRRKYE